MDKAALVSVDVGLGQEIVEALDKAGAQTKVALWLHSPEYGDWRLVIVARAWEDMKLREAYQSLHEALSSAGVSLERTPPVLILRMADPFVKELRRLFGRTKATVGMRLGGQLIGDRFVDDAFVYRIK